MLRSVAAGTAYATAVFIIGFFFGTLRVLWIAPHVGELVAVCLEAPIMLAVSWIIAQRCSSAVGVPRRAAERLVMGAAAFAVLMLWEWGVASAVFGRATGQFLRNYLTAPGFIGLLTQLVFASFPLMQRWLPRARAGARESHRP